MPRPLAEERPADAGTPSADEFPVRLAGLVRRVVAGARGIENLRALSGGAVQETWAFDAVGPAEPVPLILRRARGKIRQARGFGIDLAGEAALVRHVAERGVPVPDVRAVLTPDDGLGEGFVMLHVTGETIPRRILRDAEFAALRPRLARECGAILARIHAAGLPARPALEPLGPSRWLDRRLAEYDAVGAPGPVFEFAFRWLAENLPAPAPLTLVHGDFRNGNLIVGPEGIRAVLDWELAHVGDPMEDLGWLCVTSWRFGNVLPVGGFGTLDELIAGYEGERGSVVDRARIHFWEVAGTLAWGIMCAQMARQFETGIDPSIERGAIGRRAAPKRKSTSCACCSRRPEGEVQNSPPATSLVGAVVAFLRERIARTRNGDAFATRVAANALQIVQREIALGPAARAAELTRLANLLGRDGDAGELNAELCRLIRAGAAHAATPGLRDHLWETTLARLAIDQPLYASYRRTFADD